MHVLALLAATSTSVRLPTNLVTVLTGSGVFGAILLDVSVFHRVFVPRWVHDETIKQRDKVEAEKDAQIATLRQANAEFTEQMLTVVVPTLTRAVDTNKDYVEVLERGLRDRT